MLAELSPADSLGYSPMNAASSAQTNSMVTYDSGLTFRVIHLLSCYF